MGLCQLSDKKWLKPTGQYLDGSDPKLNLSMKKVSNGVIQKIIKHDEDSIQFQNKQSEEFLLNTGIYNRPSTVKDSKNEYIFWKIVTTKQNICKISPVHKTQDEGFLSGNTNDNRLKIAPCSTSAGSNWLIEYLNPEKTEAYIQLVQNTKSEFKPFEPGTFRLKCLSEQGNGYLRGFSADFKLEISKNEALDGTKWKITGDEDQGYWIECLSQKFENKALSGVMNGVTGAFSLILFMKSNGQDSTWYFEKEEDGSYKIRNERLMYLVQRNNQSVGITKSKNDGTNWQLIRLKQ